MSYQCGQQGEIPDEDFLRKNMECISESYHFPLIHTHIHTHTCTRFQVAFLALKVDLSDKKSPILGIQMVSYLSEKEVMA